MEFKDIEARAKAIFAEENPGVAWVIDQIEQLPYLHRARIELEREANYPQSARCV
jgi:hypothetical protein